MHALAQAAHFDLAREWPPDTVRAAVNFHLRPDPIAVLDCAVVPESFDARFSAVARHYRYRILARKAPPALDRGRVWWVPRPLSAAAMGEAALLLVGGTTLRLSAPPPVRPGRPSRPSIGWP